MHLATLGSVLTGVAGQSVLLVSGVVSARLLGVVDRGHLALFGLFPVVLVHLGSLGLPVAATYYIASDQSQARAVVRELSRFVVLQLAGLLVVHVAILAAVVGGSDARVVTAAAISVLSLPAILAQQYGLAVLQGQGRFREFNILRLLPAVVFAAGVAVVAVVGAGSLEVVTAIWVLSFALPAILTLFRAGNSLDRDATTPAPPLKQMLSFGIKGLLGSASPLETFRIDQAVVGLLLSPAALGLYVVGVAFTNLPRFVAQSVGMVAYPTVAERPPMARRRTMWRFVWLAAVMSTIIVAAVEFALGWLVPTLFGPEFDEAVPVARILLLSGLFLSVRRVLSDGARGAGEPGAGTLAELVSWICLVPALTILTPLMGVTGVAWALAMSSAVSLLSLIVVLTVWDGRPTRSDLSTHEHAFTPEPPVPPTIYP